MGTLSLCLSPAAFKSPPWGSAVGPPFPASLVNRNNPMTSTDIPTAHTASALTSPVRSPSSAIAFELDYFAAKLTSIREEFGDQLDDGLAHELHSLWDSVRVAQAALTTAPAVVGLGTGVWPDGTCTVDIDEFSTRWDRANEPISDLMGDKAMWAVAEWAAARARYELAFVDAMRPAPASRAERSARLSEAEAKLERACEAVGMARVPVVSPRPRRRR